LLLAVQVLPAFGQRLAFGLHLLVQLDKLLPGGSVLTIEAGQLLVLLGLPVGCVDRHLGGAVVAAGGREDCQKWKQYKKT
jgi:hypothetical protein